MWSFPLQALPLISDYPALAKIDSGAVSNAAFLQVDLPAGFRTVWFVFDGLRPVTNAVSFRLNTRVAGGSFARGASDYRFTTSGSRVGVSTFQVVNGSPAGRIEFNHAAMANGIDAVGEITLYNPRDSVQRSRISGHLNYFGNAIGQCLAHTAGYRDAAEDVDAFEVFFNSGNIATMNWTLYGLRA